MAFDMAISESGDLIVTAHGDIAGVAGDAVIAQRIRNRLLISRGSWVYDTQGTLGSQLHLLLGKSSNEIPSLANAYVREALRGMDEIIIDNIRTELDEYSLTVIVDYHPSTPSLPVGVRQFLTTAVTVASMQQATLEGGD